MLCAQRIILKRVRSLVRGRLYVSQPPGFVRLVSGKGDRTMAIEAANKVAAQGGRTDAVVKSFRDLVKRGRPQIKPERVDEVFRETLGLISPTLQREGVDVAVSIERGIRRIMIDKLQIEQVLINLMSNAVEAMAANTSGEKHLSLRAQNMAATGEVEITVSDSGPGFPSNFDIRRPALFASAKEDGLGVGLSFGRTIAEKSRWRVDNRRRRGRSRCLTAVAGRARSFVMNPGLTVAVIDDDEAVLELITHDTEPLRFRGPLV